MKTNGGLKLWYAPIFTMNKKMILTKEVKSKILNKLLEQSLPIVLLLGGMFGIVNFLVSEIDKKDNCNQEFIKYVKQQRAEDRKTDLEYIKVLERNNLLYERLLNKLDK